MHDKAEKRSARSLRNGAMRAVPALMTAGVFACSTMAYGQSAAIRQTLPASGQAATQPADTDDTLDAFTPSPGTATGTTSTAAAGGNDSATNTPDPSANAGLRLDGAGVDPQATGSVLDEDMRRLNLREAPVDEQTPRRPEEGEPQTDGIRLGSFILRPTVSQTVNVEKEKGGGSDDNRTFLETGTHTTLTSDWSLHQLTLTADGVWQRNVSGTGSEQPAFSLDGDLRLDLPRDTTAHITGGYRFYREDTDDPNAISDADKQSDVQRFSGGLSIGRDLGLLRGSAGIDLSRTIYSDAELADGTEVSLSDRNQTAGTLRGRIGYELSPALIPFVEASIGRDLYDEERDAAGFARSSYSYGAKAGMEVDLGEKLRGELGVGYEQVNFQDDRLSSIGTATIDGSLFWSPHRGTDVNIGLSTSVEPSTTPDVSGYVSYQLTSTVTHELRDNLVASLTGSTILRDYPSDSSSSDETVYAAGAGLTWRVNRYLDMISNVGYELTKRDQGGDTRQWRAGLGLQLKR